MSRSIKHFYRPLQSKWTTLESTRAKSIGIRSLFVSAPTLSHFCRDEVDACKQSGASSRNYHSTPTRLKGKGSPKRSVQVASQRSEAAGDDPFDFQDLSQAITEVHEKLRSALRQISPAGQVNQESIEAVRVKLKSGETVPVSDLAQVVPRSGRTIAIMVGQVEHVKQLSAAILGQLAVNPVPGPQDPQELLVTVPAPTQESRKHAQKQVVEAGERGHGALRNARSAQQKRHRAMEISRRVQEDDLRKAGKEMDKIMEKATAEVKKTIDAAKRAMDR